MLPLQPTRTHSASPDANPEPTPRGPVLHDRVSQAIAANPHLEGRRLRFETSNGRVVLQGVVRTYFQKQMAQEALRGLEGVAEIENRLEVTW